MSIYKRPNSPHLWCKFFVRGELIRLSTGETTRRAAEAAERKLRAEAENSPADRSSVALGEQSMATLAVWDQTRAINSSPEHQKVLRQRWDRILASLGADTHPSQVTGGLLARYVKERKDEGLKGQTIKRELTDIKRALLEAVERGYIVKLPSSWPKLKDDTPNYERSGKLHDPAFVEALKNELPHDITDAIGFVHATGLRFGEIRRVDIAWLVRPEYKAEVPFILRLPREATKSKKARTVGIAQETADMMLHRAAEVGPLIFPRVAYSKPIKTACKRLGYAGTVTLRDLRHMFGSEALERSGNIQAVSDALGHSALTTTLKYLHSKEQQVANLAFKGTQLRAHEPQGTQNLGTALDIAAKSERETGLEPATFSLGSVRIGSNVEEFRVKATKRRREKPKESISTGHTNRAHAKIGHTGDHALADPWVSVECLKCGTLDVLSPATGCPVCGGGLLERAVLGEGMYDVSTAAELLEATPLPAGAK